VVEDAENGDDTRSVVKGAKPQGKARQGQFSPRKRIGKEACNLMIRKITSASIPRLLRKAKPGIPRELEALRLSLEHWKENWLATKRGESIRAFIHASTCACCSQAVGEGFRFGNDCPYFTGKKCPLAFRNRCCGGRWTDVFLANSKTIIRGCKEMVLYIHKALVLRKRSILDC